MRRPLVVLSSAWILGYVLAYMLDGRPLAVVCGSLVCIAALVMRALNVPWKLSCVTLAATVVAAAYFSWFDARNVTRFPPHPAGSGDAEPAAAVRGTIASVVEVDGDRVSFVVKTKHVRLENETEWQALSEKIQVHIRLLEQEEQTKARKWKRGDIVELSGRIALPEPARNFGGFDYRDYLRLRHIHRTLSVKGLDGVKAVPPDGWNLYRALSWNDAVRNALGSVVDRLFDGEQEGFMKGLLIGLREDLDERQFAQFSRLGLTHILAISGLHVVVFLWGCIGIMRLCGLTKETYLLVAMLLVPFYVLLSGASPSVVRAGIMAIIALYAARRSLLKDGLHIIAAAAFFMLVCNPYYLLDVSFQLSFLVTAGLIAGVPVVGRLLPIRSKMLNGAVAVTLVSQWVSFPLTVYYFNQFSLLSWLANLLLVPLFSFIVLPAGSAALMIGMVNIQMGSWLAKIAERVNDICFWLIDVLNRSDLFVLIWPSPSKWWIAVYYTLLFAVMWSLVRIRQDRRMAAAAIVSAGCIAVLLWHGYNPDRRLQEGAVHFLDVGQGDSILIRAPSDRYILVDGGGTLNFRKPGEEWKDRKDPFEVGRKLLVPLLKKRGVHQIDYLIVSHEDADHLGGLQAVIEQIPVRHLVFNGTLKPDERTAHFFRTALEKRIPLLAAHEGRTLRIDRHTSLEFLFPEKPRETGILKEPEQNSQSVVFLLQIFQSRFLFTGDIGLSEEQQILKAVSVNRQLPKSPIDVLKVAHHGSRNSTSPQWIGFWKPDAAVISAGKSNVYGHPNEQTLIRLQRQKAAIYRTDRHGEVQMKVTAGSLLVRTKLGGDVK